MILLKILLYFILGEGVRDMVRNMAIVYAMLIIKDKKTFSSVHTKLKDQVKEILTGMGVPELATE